MKSMIAQLRAFHNSHRKVADQLNLARQWLAALLPGLRHAAVSMTGPRGMR